MKKKILITLLSLGLIFSNGCGPEIINSEEVTKRIKIGPYIEISHEEGKDFCGSKIVFYSMYHEDTKIMYIMTFKSIGYDDYFTINYDFDYDESGHPVLKFYEGKD